MNELIKFIRNKFKEPKAFIPLHTPVFIGNEKKYLNECIDSTFVSSVGKFVDRFEEMIMEITGAKYAVATVNGTAALHIAMYVLGIKERDEVITQPLTFIATCNAISYTGATPVFVDVNRDTMGMSPTSLEAFLNKNCELIDGKCVNKNTNNKIKACVPMHTFGFPCRIEEIISICNKWSIPVIEDSAESMGSFVGDKHTGTFGKLGVFSFNGNKIVTAGGGGCVVTDDEIMAKRLKHITTTAKEAHRWNYKHDEIGFNYRMPNINAALLCAQLEMLPKFLENKRELAEEYKSFFQNQDVKFRWESEGTRANYWLNTIELKNKEERDAFLEQTNNSGIMTRPVWDLMTSLTMFKDFQKTDISNAEWLEGRLVNIPSSVID